MSPLSRSQLRINADKLLILVAGFTIGLLMGTAVNALTDPCGNRSYASALNFATQAVNEGKKAPTLSNTDADDAWQAAERHWNQALATLDDVKACSKYYNDAQTRLASYTDYRQQVQQQLSKGSSN